MGKHHSHREHRLRKDFQHETDGIQTRRREEKIELSIPTLHSIPNSRRTSAASGSSEDNVMPLKASGKEKQTLSTEQVENGFTRREKEERSVERVASLRSLWALPENKRCADCKEIGTDWVSVNLGLFLCVRCAGVHRSLGTHISRVKSITMDAWLPAEVALLQTLGNAVGARLFEAHAPTSVLRTAISTDRERSERIRRKYETREYAAEDVWDVLKNAYRKAGYGKYRNTTTFRTPESEGGRHHTKKTITTEMEEEDDEDIHRSGRNGGMEKRRGKNVEESQRLSSSHLITTGPSKKSTAPLRMEVFTSLYGVTPAPLWPSKEFARHGSGCGGKEEEREVPEARSSETCHAHSSISSGTPLTSDSTHRVVNERGIFGVINVPEKEREAHMKRILRYFQMELGASPAL